MVVPLFLRGLKIAWKELFSVHWACLDPLPNTLLPPPEPPPPGTLAKPKAVQEHVTDYTRERKGRKKPSRKSSKSH